MLFPYISLECLLKYTLFSKSVKLCKKCIDRWTHSLTDYDGTQIKNDYINSLMEFANSHHVEIIQIKADSFPADG